jgi:hypothetical protein
MSDKTASVITFGIFAVLGIGLLTAKGGSRAPLAPPPVVQAAPAAADPSPSSSSSYSAPDYETSYEKNMREKRRAYWKDTRSGWEIRTGGDGTVP